MSRENTKEREGVVISNKMKKTVVVEVEGVYHHPLYQKTIRQTKRFKAHDALGQCRVGDRVVIAETRPLSKEKRWAVVRGVKS